MIGEMNEDVESLIDQFMKLKRAGVAGANQSGGASASGGGGGGGQHQSRESGLPTPEMQLITMLAQGGQLGPAATAGRAYAASADGSIAGANRHKQMMDRSFAAADPNNSMDWDSSALMNRPHPQIPMQGFNTGRNGLGTMRMSQRADGPGTGNEYRRRQQELKYRDQDADFEDSRRQDLLALLKQATGGNFDEREVTEGDQYVNNAGRWDRMPTRQVRTKSLSPIDLLRMLGG